MSKTQTLREVLAAAAGPLTLDEIIAAAEKAGGSMFNRKKTRDLLSFMTRQGEVMAKGRGDARSYRTGKRKTAKKTPHKSKPRAAGAQTSAPRSYKDIVRKQRALHEPPALSLLDTGFLRRHVGTTLAAFAELVDHGALDDDASAATAFRSHQKAVQLLLGGANS